MTGFKDHGYAWADLRERSARSLAVGDVWVSPASFAAHAVSEDGRVTGVFGWDGPRGIAWTVIARDRHMATCRSHVGREETAMIPERARVLVVVEEGSK